MLSRLNIPVQDENMNPTLVVAIAKACVEAKEKNSETGHRSAETPVASTSSGKRARDTLSEGEGSNSSQKKVRTAEASTAPAVAPMGRGARVRVPTARKLAGEEE